ncbi:1-acyl-sn-glycerol-3-phosphate acyltransferase [Rhodobacter sp. Har01]|uniref:lysophospholipid acyltransferase family protein n=1 Tax=Rhodobacter sp. Har01 TaxID=2883999 RepID=UPI001D0849C4|nr:lysophospholipid acyltransferase family protein [Rhodobacter sp. Har01]MCB6177336.1 1-acyl-sn-glycerol-3-phosphate acyltransferase [Rhodobacter sp. Har01]
MAYTAVTKVAGDAVSLFVRIVTAPRAIWAGSLPIAGPRVYFANHTSNADFVLIWTLLPPVLRRRTRPVAALDYWLTSPLRAFFGRDVFRAVLIDRRPEARSEDPVAQMIATLDAGSALIMFPEGKRNTSDAPLLPFKSGLYHLARQRPEIDLIPVWISNLNRVMPKGEIVPVPLICTVTYGAAVRINPDEPKENFLARASAALGALHEPRP